MYNTTYPENSINKHGSWYAIETLAKVSSDKWEYERGKTSIYRERTQALLTKLSRFRLLENHFTGLDVDKIEDIERAVMILNECPEILFSTNDKQLRTPHAIKYGACMSKLSLNTPQTYKYAQRLGLKIHWEKSTNKPYRHIVVVTQRAMRAIYQHLEYLKGHCAK